MPLYTQIKKNQFILGFINIQVEKGRSCFLCKFKDGFLTFKEILF